MKLYKNPLEDFVDELRELMIKHDIRSITPLGDKMEISLDENRYMTFVWSNIQTGIKEKKNADMLLDQYNNYITLFNMFGDGEYKMLAEESLIELKKL